MKSDYIRNFVFLLCAMGVLAQHSCKKEEEELEPPRIFRPVAQVDNSIERVLIAYFKAIDGAVLYEADISMDSLFLDVEHSLTISPDTADIYYDNTKYTHFRFENLLAAQEYFIRIKAIHADSTMNSGYYETRATTLSLFIPPSPNEILDVAFVCKWDIRGEPLTKIRIYDESGEVIIAQLRVSGTDNSNGFKLIEDLIGSTTYWVYLYSGDVVRGRGMVTTQLAIEGENIVDLTLIQSSSVLQDTIPNVPSGSVIILKRGFIYEFTASPQINGSLTIRSGYDFIPDLAVIKLNGNSFNVPTFCDFDEIVLKDISMKSTWEGSSYVFHLDSCNINRIEFDNVKTYGHRGFFRVSRDASVNTLSMNNCLVDTCREYGICHISGENASVQNIDIRNSTFSYVVRPFFCTSEAVSNSNTITLENCTFFHTPEAGRHFFDYVVGTSVTIRNCIMGKHVNIWNATGLPKGYRAYKENTDGTIIYPVDITYINSYKTTEFVQDETSADDPPLDLIPYDGTASDLFVDPENGNYKLKDGGFAGRYTAGDPRWW